MKIYTGFGDSGVSKLIGSEILKKDHPIFEVLGTVDELNGIIGIILSKKVTKTVKGHLNRIQKELYLLCSELASSKNNSRQMINEKLVTAQEDLIDQIDKNLKPLKNFIIQGGTEQVCLLHFARAVCRRAERRLVTLKQKNKVNKFHLMYLNRLSDLFFVMARYENDQAGREERILDLKG